MTHLCTAARELCPVCWRCEACCHCYEDQLTQLTDVLVRGPELAGEPSGEWGLTVARGYARRVLAAGWRPPNVPPASAPVAAPPGPAHEAVTPVPPAGGTPGGAA